MLFPYIKKVVLPSFSFSPEKQTERTCLKNKIGLYSKEHINVYQRFKYSFASYHGLIKHSLIGNAR